MMMKNQFAVRAHDLASKTSIEKLLEAVGEYDFKKIQFVFPKALDPYSYDEEFVKHVSSSLKKAGVSVSMLGAYFNMVHSDPEVVRKGILNFYDNLRIAHHFGHAYVGSETGSFNDSPWIYHPKNRTEEGYQQSKAVWVELAKFAEEVDEHILIEPAFGHVMWDAKTLKRLIDEISSKHVHVTLDLYNLLDPSNFEKRDEIFEEAVKLFNEEIKVIHLKDATIKDGKLVQLDPGFGEFHYDSMLKLIKTYCPKAVLTFEGVKKPGIAQSIEILNTKM